jgi:6-phosphogluconolactonase (cycloisomerase 2 family)
VVAGSEAVFAVVAHGTEALSYQWRRNGAPIVGANAPTLKLTSVTSADATGYSVQVSNSAGIATSDVALLNVSAGVPAAVAPTIVNQPASVLVNTGNTATVAVGAAGTGPLGYQWLRNGTPIGGATAAYYSIAAATSGDAGSYSVQVSNSAGSVTSSGAVLTVNPSAAATVASLVTQPSPQVQAPGGSATFAVAVTGSGPISYQWLKDGVAIPAAASGVLTLSNVAAGDAAGYSVTVSNSLGSVTSNAATLTVLGVPAIASQPAAATVIAGNTATFNVSATGSNLRYQWTRNNVAIGGAENASYTTPTLALSDNGAVYGVVVYTGAGVVFSSGALLTVNAAPVGGLALVANSGVTNGTNGLSVYRVNSTTGTLTFLNSVDAGNTPYAIAVAPNGLYAYVTNQIGGTVSSYSIDSVNGVVSLIPLSSPGSNNASGIAMDRLGRFIWVANYGWHTLSAFVIGANGVLAAVGSPLATTSSLPYAITAHPTLDVVYVAHASSNFAVTVYGVNPATGALTLQQTVTNVIVSPSGLVVDPSGRFAYALSQNGGVSVFAINASTGLLTYRGATSTNGAAFAIAAHPNGQYVYVTIGDSSNNVVVFAINQSTGALTSVGSPYTTGSYPRGVTVNAAGTYLYVTNYGSNDVTAFSISGGGGTLSSLGAAAATGSQPQGIATTP